MKSLLSLANKYENILNSKAAAPVNSREALKTCAVYMINMYQTWLNLLASKNFTPADGTFKYTEALQGAKSMANESFLYGVREEDLPAIKQKFINALNKIGGDIMFDAQSAGWYNKGTGIWSDASAKDAAFKIAEIKSAALNALEQSK